MRKMTEANLSRLYESYKLVYALCDALQIDGVVGDVRIEANKAKNALYIAWQQAIVRLEEGE